MSEKLTSEELQLAIDNIHLEIRASDSGVTTVKLKPAEVVELEHIERHLYVDGRTFEFDPHSFNFKIDSSKCPQP